MTAEEPLAAIVECTRCPRLVSWRQEVAAAGAPRYEGEHYWGRPVPGFGDPNAPVMAVGLAPAAHGANRTGRMFTGDRSGDFLFAAASAVGLANQAVSLGRDDGLVLSGLYVTSIVHCAPPANRPTPEERDTCRTWLESELELIGPRVVVALGAMAYQQILRILTDAGAAVPVPRPRFGHGLEIVLDRHHPAVVASYHPSQHNTFTGRLTPQMMESVLARAVELAGSL